MTEPEFLGALTRLGGSEWTTAKKRLRLGADCPLTAIARCLYPEESWSVRRPYEATKVLGLPFEIAARVVWAADGRGKLGAGPDMRPALISCLEHPRLRSTSNDEPLWPLTACVSFL